jgi:hypothetical protein
LTTERQKCKQNFLEYVLQSIRTNRQRLAGTSARLVAHFHLLISTCDLFNWRAVMKNRYRFVLAITIMALSFTPAIYQAVAQTPVNPANPLLFVTQVPIPNDFITVTAVFGNHQPTMLNAGRGGDLYSFDGERKSRRRALDDLRYDGPADLVASARRLGGRMA